MIRLTIDFRRTVYDGIRCMCKTNKINAIFFAIQCFFRSKVKIDIYGRFSH